MRPNKRSVFTADSTRMVLSLLINLPAIEGSVSVDVTRVSFRLQPEIAAEHAGGRRPVASRDDPAS
jgi:hypothetical protein